MPISLTKLISPDKQNHLPGDSSDADQKTEDFAALLSTPFLTPQPIAPKPIEFQPAVSNGGDAFSSEKPGVHIPDPIRVEPHLIAESKPLAPVFPPCNTTMDAGSIDHHSKTIEGIDPQIVAARSNKTDGRLKTNLRDAFATPNKHLPLTDSTINDSTDLDFPDHAPQEFPAKLSVPLGDFPRVASDDTSGSTAPIDDPSEKLKRELSLGNNGPASDEKASNMQNFRPQGSDESDLKSGQTIGGESAPILDVNEALNAFPTVASILKADDYSSKTNVTSDFVIGRLIGEQNEIGMSSEVKPNLGEAGAEAPKDKTGVLDDSSDGQFNNFLSSFSKNSKVADGPPQPADMQVKVSEQIESRILELAAYTQAGGEKRIFKMRLNPAELGGVEITLEKSAAGKISAHFQTESESTRHLLNESLTQLRTSLENSGVQVGELEISCRSSSSNEDAGGEGRTNNFGTTENPPTEDSAFGGHSHSPDDNQIRLVNLRA